MFSQNEIPHLQKTWIRCWIGLMYVRGSVSLNHTGYMSKEYNLNTNSQPRQRTSRRPLVHIAIAGR